MTGFGATMAAGANVQTAVAVVTAFGVGAVVAAIITAIATSRREFKSWLRVEQVRANREFYRSAIALQTYVVSGPAREAIANLDDNGLANAINGVYEYTVDLAVKFQDITELAGPKTHHAAVLVSKNLPLLAWQSIPLPGALNAGSRKQRADALQAIVELTVNFSFAMRRDVRVVPWIWRWKAVFDVWKFHRKLTYKEQVLSPTDRGISSSPGDLLREWQVGSLNGGIAPTTDNDYRIFGPISATTAIGTVTPLALCVKPAFAPWQFGIVGGLPESVEYEIVADAARAVTGNFTGYNLRYQPFVHQDSIGTRIIAWL